MINTNEEYNGLEPDVIQNSKDNVNHPSHYEKSCSLECIDVMEAMFGPGYLIIFCLMNSFKYLWRHKNKNGKEDLDKANWYLEKAKSVFYSIGEFEDYEFEDWSKTMIERISELYLTACEKSRKGE